MRRLSAGLKDIVFPNNSETDEVLIALAGSPAAATLRTIDLFYNEGILTDACSDTLRCFVSLDTIMLDSPNLTRKTLNELTALPKLRKLFFKSAHISAHEIIQDAIEKELILEEIFAELDPDNMASESMIIIDLLRKNPWFTANLRCLHLSKYGSLDGDECEKIKRDLFQVCPSLESPPGVFRLQSLRMKDANP
jgi:hypothetical protein